MKDKTQTCIHCNLCTKNCYFLKKYNMDLEEFSKEKIWLIIVFFAESAKLFVLKILMEKKLL